MKLIYGNIMLNKLIAVLLVMGFSSFTYAEYTYSCSGFNIEVDDGNFTRTYQLSGRSCDNAIVNMFESYICYDSRSMLNAATGSNRLLYVEGSKDCYYMAENSVNGYYCLNSNMVLNLRTNENSGIPNGKKCDDFINGY